MEIRSLKEEELYCLYHREVSRDFPAEELKPWEAMQPLLQEGHYDALVFFQNKTAVAYALLITNGQGRTALLDYFAVEPALRGTGIGTRVLAELSAYYRGQLSGILLETEDPSGVPDRETARRRIAFYQRAGACDTGLRAEVFGILYRIFSIPCSDSGAYNTYDELQALYRIAIPPHLYDSMLDLTPPAESSDDSAPVPAETATQAERLTYCIRRLVQENSRYRSLSIPEEETERRMLLRALMNVRPPLPTDAAFLQVQDSYLRGVLEEKGITASGTLLPCASDPRLVIWQGDITTLRVDAIVNAANSGMLGCFSACHSCIDNAIHTYAGVQLRLACHRLMQAQGHDEPTGQAKITPAYNLPSRFVLHTVGPIVDGPLTEEHRRLLASCYRSCLELAAQVGVKSIAFCCISTGVFGFPNAPAAETAVKTVKEFLKETDQIERVVFNVFKDEDLRLYRGFLG